MEPADQSVTTAENVEPFTESLSGGRSAPVHERRVAHVQPFLTIRGVGSYLNPSSTYSIDRDAPCTRYASAQVAPLTREPTLQPKENLAFRHTNGLIKRRSIINEQLSLRRVCSARLTGVRVEVLFECPRNTRNTRRCVGAGRGLLRGLGVSVDVSDLMT